MTQQTTTSTLVSSLDDERLQPFLPLVYAAWADGELTAEEISGICTAIAVYPGIDVDCQVALRHWLDPEHPPAPDDLDRLRRHIAKWTSLLDEPATASVTDLGIAIAETSRTQPKVTEAERAALADLSPHGSTVGKRIRSARSIATSSTSLAARSPSATPSPPPGPGSSPSSPTRRRVARYGLVSICGAGATAAAMVLERSQGESPAVSCEP